MLATFGGVEVRNYGLGTAEVITTWPAPDVRLVNGVASYVYTDQLGSVRTITGPGAAVQRQAVYRPFGQAVVAVAGAEPRGWIGERFDAGAGLQYLNARYYDPALGLFLTPDWFPVTAPGVGTNRYTYAGGDPVNGADPFGNEIIRTIVYDQGSFDDPEPGGFKADFDVNCGTRTCTPSMTTFSGGVISNDTRVATFWGRPFQNNSYRDSINAQGGIPQRDAALALAGLLSGQLTAAEALNMAMTGNTVGGLGGWAGPVRGPEMGGPRGVTNPGVPSLPVPAFPPGMTRNEFGTNLIGWGAGPAGATSRLDSLTASDVVSMQAGGLTREMATQWRDFYANEAIRNSYNYAALPRAQLMDQIVRIMEGGP